MRLAFLALVLALAGCPNKTASSTGEEPTAEKKAEDTNKNPYKNVMPSKVKADVEASQKKEEDRDDKILEKAKQ